MPNSLSSSTTLQVLLFVAVMEQSWEFAIPNGGQGHAHSSDAEDIASIERLKRIEALAPDIAAVLRQQTDLIAQQNEQIERNRQELNDQLRTLKASLDRHAVTQGALQCIRSVVAQLDNDTTTNGNYKRPLSPRMGYPYPESQPAVKKSRKRQSAGVPYAPNYLSQQTSRPALVEYQSPYPIQQSPIGTSRPLDLFIAEAQQAQDPTGPPAFALSRDVRNVRDLWKEYTQGINGQASVQEMDEQWGPRWRNSSKEAVFYCLRKVIYDEIKRLRDEEYNGDVDSAVAMLDQKMLAGNMPSLNKLGNVLKVEKLERTGRRATMEPQENDTLDDLHDQPESWPPSQALQHPSLSVAI